jgi:hypothetical protein
VVGLVTGIAIVQVTSHMLVLQVLHSLQLVMNTTLSVVGSVAVVTPYRMHQVDKVR